MLSVTKSREFSLQYNSISSREVIMSGLIILPRIGGIPQSPFKTRAAYNVQKYGFGTVVKVMCRCDFCVFACRIFKALIPFSPAALLFALACLFTLKRYVKAEHGQFYSQAFAKIGTKFFISQSLFRRVYRGLREQLRLQAKANP